MLSTIVTILHIRSSDFIHLVAENVYFTKLSQFPAPSPQLSQFLATTFLLSVSMKPFFF